MANPSSKKLDGVSLGSFFLNLEMTAAFENTGGKIKLIAGLGNPGREYERTRHNIGFALLDEIFTSRGNSGGSWREKFSAQLGEATLGEARVILVKPLTFMNRSGGPLGQVMQFYKVEPSEIIVVHDEIDLPFGTVRVKSGGGDAGHNGIRSVVEVLGTPDFCRVRLGVGRPSPTAEGSSPIPVRDWVLSRFGADERPIVESMLATGCEAVTSLISYGLKATQGKFH